MFLIIIILHFMSNVMTMVRSFLIIIFLASYLVDNVGAAEGNTGTPVEPGTYAHFVLFMKKPNTTFSSSEFKELPSSPPDYSVNGFFISSGTIVSRRYALSRATPIAYYPPTSYWMVPQHEISLEIDPDLMTLIDIDFVVVHPAHARGNNSTDIALLRTTTILEFSFGIRNVNLQFGHAPISLTNCRLLVWSWLPEDGKFVTLRKAAMPFTINETECSEGESDYNKTFICLSQTEAKNEPCALSSGSPVVCSSVLAGIYLGTSETGAACTGSPSQGYNALRVDTGETRDWLKDILTDPVADDADNNRVTLATCPTNKTL